MDGSEAVISIPSAWCIPHFGTFGDESGVGLCVVVDLVVDWGALPIIVLGLQQISPAMGQVACFGPWHDEKPKTCLITKLEVSWVATPHWSGLTHSIPAKDEHSHGGEGVVVLGLGLQQISPSMEQVACFGPWHDDGPNSCLITKPEVSWVATPHWSGLTHSNPSKDEQSHGGGAGGGEVFSQHTSMSFSQVVFLLSIWILTGLKISSTVSCRSSCMSSENPPCLMSILFVVLLTLTTGPLILPKQS